MNRALIGVIVVVTFVAGAGITTLSTSSIGRTTTVTRVQSILITTTVTSLRAGAALTNYSGSGNANSPPFTATTPTVELTLTVAITSGNLSFGAVSWYLYQVSGLVPFDQGSVNGKSGSFTFYSYDLIPGSNYYVKLLSANADWNVVVSGSRPG